MTRCPACHKELPPEASVCASCGFTLEDAATRQLETPRDPRPSARPSARKSEADAATHRVTPSFESIDDARFVPGAILANRYRIVGLLGRGGMGEVYRADDLKLSHPVALKFLPDNLMSDDAALSRFHREVRVARQVSHKNVCRVYDIGEVEGHHFISMEFIKGEELSSLLRRVGRPQPEKASQMARQLCAGLAAAHDVGVLHRDLKPANIMVDADGNVRITDFGLAGLAREFSHDEVTAGTPAYMAPEQILGEGVSLKSDIYSLGLVLYELFTGRRAFEAPTLGDLMKLRRSESTPRSPSEFVKDIDPVVERVIDRCLKNDPSLRPSSALQVAAALPGGDPLAEALAAGETPSPEMVAAAPREGALRPAVALALFGSLIISLILITLLANKIVLHGYVPLEKSTEVLRENARDVIRSAGASTSPTDHMHWFSQSDAPLRYIARTDTRSTRWQDLKDGQPAAVFYWYRQSPSYLAGFDYFRDPWTNPGPVVSGMAGVKLDTRGRLLHFYSVPPQVDSIGGNDSDPAAGSETSTSNPPDTSQFLPLFAAANLDMANFKPAQSQWAPLYMNDTRAAWEGFYPDQPSIPIRIEAASYRGKPVHFEIVNPWDRPERQQPSGLSAEYKALLTLLLSVFVIVLIGGVVLAVRNLRLGRGDRKGALRLGILVATVTQLSRLAEGHHIPTFGELGVILNGLQDSLFAGAFLGVVYLAFEPFVRRRWPHRIISWTRLLAGDFRDPLVGRDFLIGILIGFGMSLWQIFFFFFRTWINDFNLMPVSEPSVRNLGIGYFLQAFSDQLTTSIVNGFQPLFIIVLLALIFRRDWLGFITGWLLFTTGLALLFGGSAANWMNAAVTAGLITFTLYRFGLLAMLSAIFSHHMYINFPVTTHLTAWYAIGFLIDFVLILVLSFYAFRISLAGQPVFGGKLLDDNVQ